MTFQGNKKLRTYSNVKNFWENEGKNRGDTPFATIRDHYFRNIEINEIINFFLKRKLVTYLILVVVMVFLHFFLANYQKKFWD